ncbi:MAG: polyprenyl synthetase family protein [Butyrivibrio sp.]|nr:polyprenyl synthetase family protein [Butyrivibrio sp.]
MTDLHLDFDRAFEMVREESADIINRAPGLIRGYTSYLTEAQGKMMRAAATLACSMNSEEEVPKDAVIFASAVETLHLATLIHDDIMDDADLRRGLVTLQKKSGKRTAVICGDYLLAAAMRQLSKATEDDRYKKFDFSKYVERVALGELRQNINNRNYRLDVFRYLAIIDGKTAALFEGAYHAGALAGGESEDRIKLFRKLGRYTGIIFQLTDDCIDYEVSKNKAGKPVQADFENGVITMPFIHALKENPSLVSEAENGSLSKERVLEEVEKHGGVSFTHRMAESYYNKCCNIIETLGLTGKRKEVLAGLVDRAYRGLN